MTSFILENAYLNYMMQVVNDTTKTITADAVVTNPDCNIRDLYGTQTTIENAREIADKIERALPTYKTSIRVTAQATYGVGVSSEAVDGCTIQGIDPDEDDKVTNIKSKIIKGRFFEDNDPILRGHTPLYIEIKGPGNLPDFTYGSGQRLFKYDEPYPIIVGATAAKIHPSIIKVGNVINLLISASGRGTRYAAITVKIIGLYESGTPTLDAMIWFMHADSLREIKSYGEIKGKEWHIPGVGTFRGFKPIEVNQNMGDAILIKAPEPLHQLDPIGYSEHVKEEIIRVVPNMRVFSWHDLLIYAAGSMQDVVTIMLWGSMGVTLFLCGAAIKYVMDSIVIRKTREIGSLKAFGARDRTIFKIFLYQGVFIGSLAGVLGIIISILVMNVINWYGLSVQFIAGTQLKIGFVVNWLTVLVALVVPILLSILAASIPAKKASMLPPVEALRKGEISL
jgi:ABC-type lipoprotein release transport system permease subunit